MRNKYVVLAQDASSVLVLAIEVREEIDQGWKIRHRDVGVVGQASARVLEGYNRTPPVMSSLSMGQRIDGAVRPGAISEEVGPEEHLEREPEGFAANAGRDNHASNLGISSQDRSEHRLPIDNTTLMNHSKQIDLNQLGALRIDREHHSVERCFGRLDHPRRCLESHGRDTRLHGGRGSRGAAGRPAGFGYALGAMSRPVHGQMFRRAIPLVFASGTPRRAKASAPAPMMDCSSRHIVFIR